MRLFGKMIEGIEVNEKVPEGYSEMAILTDKGDVYMRYYRSPGATKCVVVWDRGGFRYPGSGALSQAWERADRKGDIVFESPMPDPRP
jgi:hypothetical protein